MAKQDTKPAESTSTPTYTDKLISTDHTGGKLIYRTDRPEGQKVLVTIGGRERACVVTDGQIWVRTSQTLYGFAARIEVVTE